MNLVIDFGNTRVKAALFDGEKLVKLYENVEKQHLTSLIDPSIEGIIVSSVSLSHEQVKELLNVPFVFLTHSTNLPFNIKYKTPQTLGLDRIAAIAGAEFKYPETNCLVIDIGTCITYDFIDENKNYYGGAISPGIGIRFKSLNTFTAKLPLVSPTYSTGLIGSSTTESIETGVILGILNEIDGFIRMYSKKYATLQVILTGGDAKVFEKKVKQDIFAAPELVLIGLNRILLNNV